MSLKNAELLNIIMGILNFMLSWAEHEKSFIIWGLFWGIMQTVQTQVPLNLIKVYQGSHYSKSGVLDSCFWFGTLTFQEFIKITQWDSCFAWKSFLGLQFSKSYDKTTYYLLTEISMENAVKMNKFARNTLN